MNRKWALKTILIMLTTIVAMTIIRPSVSATPGEEENQRLIIHPCGSPGLDIQAMTNYFLHRWKAAYIDLDPAPMARFLAHINRLDDNNIDLVRVFFSPMRTDAAVITAKHFVNFLDNKPLVDMYCVVRASKNFLAYEYDAKVLEEILREPGIGI